MYQATQQKEVNGCSYSNGLMKASWDVGFVKITPRMLIRLVGLETGKSFSHLFVCLNWVLKRLLLR